MPYVEYDHNNSGGRWWLDDADWYALEKAGWEIQWVTERGPMFDDGDGRFLGALATRAYRYDLSLGDAIEEWESVTHQDSTALGCGCCGVPHSFHEYDDKDNPLDSYSPRFPSHGDPYR